MLRADACQERERRARRSWAACRGRRGRRGRRRAARRRAAASSTIAAICRSWLCTPPGESEPQHVERGAAGLRDGDGVGQHRIARELAGRDRVVDAREVLVDDPARADVEMPDFGIAHLARRAARRRAPTRRSTCAGTWRAAGPSSASRARLIALSARPRGSRSRRGSAARPGGRRVDGGIIGGGGGAIGDGMRSGARDGAASSACVIILPSSLRRALACRCRSCKTNWMLVVVFAAVRRHAALAVRAAPLLAGEGRQQRSRPRSSSTARTRCCSTCASRRNSKAGSCRTPSTFRCRSSTTARRSSRSSSRGRSSRTATSGRRSRMAGGALGRPGSRRSTRCSGGFAAWKKDGLPVEK